MNGMYYETADREQMAQVMQQSIEAGSSQVIFKFSDDAVYQQAYDLLFGGLLEEQAQFLGRWYGLQQIYYYYQEDSNADKIIVFWQYE